MLPLFERIKTWWTAADPKQRVVTLGGVGALLLVLVGTAFFVTRPHYKVILEGLSDTEQGQVVDALTTLGIPSQHDRQGVVEVPEGRASDARMGLANAGKMPKGSTHWSKEELTKVNAFTNPAVEEETLNTIREGEIASSLETLPGVASANVLVTKPKRTAFEDDRQNATASVTIIEDGSGSLSRSKGRIIANLVCSAVQEMKPEDVVVVSNGLGEIWNGKEQGSGETKADLDNKIAHDWETKLQSALDVPFGMGNTKVIVRADVDTAKVSTVEHLVTPTLKPTSILNEQESMQGAARTASGFAGSASNTSEKALAEAPNAGDGKSKYDKKGTNKTYDTSRTDRETQGGVGDLKGLAISVVANSDKVPDASAVKQIVDGVMGGKIETDENGVAKRNQPFTTTVTSLPFDGSAALAAKEAADKLAGQQRMQQILSILPIGAILLVALLVAKQVGNISRAILPALPEPDASVAEFPAVLPNAEGVAALPSLAGGGVNEHGEPVALERFDAQVDVPLESLKQMATERPEMVATLIKSVLLGERG